MVTEMENEQQNNGQDEHPELRAHRQALDRIERNIAEMAERSRPKLTRSSMSLKEKVEYVRTHGEAAFLALPAGEPRR
jgi:hypothetical protein